MGRKKSEETIGDYLIKKKDLQFVSTGCAVLNCVLGGGYPLGRVVNIVGDKSTGKTNLAIEALANFVREYPEGIPYYIEAEAAFDIDYAEVLGMPIDKVKFMDDVDTVELLFERLIQIITEHGDNGTPAFVVVDSLDALSDKSEMEREIDKGTYGVEKARKMSELFRRLVKKIEKTNVCLFVINQIRDKIGVMFGEKHSRSGGKALDFYASQILWLSEVKKITKTIKGIDRPIGIIVKAKCKKNKVGLPFRECQFPIIFGYGIDDITANLEFLKGVKGALEELNITDDDLKNITKELEVKIAEHVVKVWNETEEGFLPKRRKYM